MFRSLFSVEIHSDVTVAVKRKLSGVLTQIKEVGRKEINAPLSLPRKSCYEKKKSAKINNALRGTIKIIN